MADEMTTPLLRVIRSRRLRLVSATRHLMEMDLEGRDALAGALGTDVPESWPPDLYGAGAMRFALQELAECSEHGWSFWYMVIRGNPGELAGIAGFKGWPDQSGSVEIGYSVLSHHQRQGFATEAVQRLVGWAFTHHNVMEVCAETFPHLSQSIKVLKKNGFRHTGAGSEAGVIRYAINRSDLN